MFSHQTERAMVQVCERVRTKYEILDQSIEQYKEVYVRARLEFEKVISVRVIPLGIMKYHSSDIPLIECKKIHRR